MEYKAVKVEFQKVKNIVKENEINKIKIIYISDHDQNTYITRYKKIHEHEKKQSYKKQVTSCFQHNH